jgi:peptidoglycan hydrolase CwlO-like protein
MSDTITVALISALGALIVSFIGVFVARTYKIGPNQEKLVQTLKDLLAIQDKKIEELQELIEGNQREITESRDKIIQLTSEIESLKNLTVSQALLIANLQSQLGGKHG